MVNFSEDELRYIHKLDDYKARSIEAFDRNLLTLSAGSIVLSVTFVRVFVNSFPAVYDWALVFSWLAFLLTIFLVLFSYLVGIKSFDNEFEKIKARKKSTDNERGKQPKDDKKGVQKRINYIIVIRSLRYASGITFFIGLLLLVFFSCSNL